MTEKRDQATTEKARKPKWNWNEVTWFVYVVDGPEDVYRVMGRKLTDGEMRPKERLMGTVTGVAQRALLRMLKAQRTSQAFLQPIRAKIAANANQQHLREQRSHQFTPAFAVQLRAGAEYREGRRADRKQAKEDEFKRQLANAQPQAI